MSRKYLKAFRVLGIAPSTRGVAYAVLENGTQLAGWGLNGTRQEDKNTKALAAATLLMAHYLPSVVVLQDCSPKTCRRGTRIRDLIKSIVGAAKQMGHKVVLLTFERVKKRIVGNSRAKKLELATEIAKRFPEDFESLVPSKRRAWESENPNHAIFEAAALALSASLRRKPTKKKQESLADHLAFKPWQARGWNTIVCCHVSRCS